MMQTRWMHPRPAGSLLRRVSNLGARRFQSSGARTDGFNEVQLHGCLPRQEPLLSRRLGNLIRFLIRLPFA
jgi:hypothetical protein